MTDQEFKARMEIGAELLMLLEAAEEFGAREVPSEDLASVCAKIERLGYARGVLDTLREITGQRGPEELPCS